MRHLLIARLEEIKYKERDFDKGLMRWKEFRDLSTGKHISEVDFQTLKDDELLMLFERVIRRFNLQM